MPSTSSESCDDSRGVRHLLGPGAGSVADGRVGDVIAGRGERPWTVVSVALPGLQIQCGADWWPRTAEDRRHLPDPDDEVQVLTPVPMAQAMALTRAELGAQVIERRNTIEGAA
jgi:hypothetical protein